jgi:Uma2 family endonuclease
MIEVLSPGNPTHDQKIKYKIYAQAGVKEYWIINGMEKIIDVFVLRGQAYAPLGHFSGDEEAVSEVLQGLKIKVSDICQ